MIFSVEQVRGIRQGKITAALVPLAARVQRNRIRALRRRVVESPRLAFSDGSHLPRVRPTRVERVEDQLPDGDRVGVVVTIFEVREVAIAELTYGEARMCGFRTVASLQASWTAEHPHADVAQLVRFLLNDVRDVPRWVGRGWPDYTSDPSRAMLGEPEAISRGDLEQLASYGTQRYLRHLADRANGLAGRPGHVRLADILRRRG